VQLSKPMVLNRNYSS